MDRAEKRGIKVEFADGTPADHVTLGVSMIVSGEERQNFGRRSHEGRLRTAQQGGIVFSGAPYGYRIVRTYDQKTGKKIHSSVEVEPDEIQVVVDMFHWLVHERETLRGIVRRLYVARILPANAKKRLVKDYGDVLPWEEIPDVRMRDGGPKKYPKRWGRSSVKAILSNSIYCGKWYYNRHKSKQQEVGKSMRRRTVGKRDKSEWVCVEAPAAISEVLFQKAQDILRKNRKQFSGRPSKHKSLLRGLIHCVCGARMYGRFVGQRNGVYLCTRSSGTNIPGD
jgi:hypothetical protein